MIEIFKTNVSNKRLAGRVLKMLHRQLPACKFNFDLEDCDRILRVQSENPVLAATEVMAIVEDCGAKIQLFVD